MKKLLTILAASLLVASASFAQKKVTYGKSTFTLYNPVSSIKPTPSIGLRAPSKGYELKQPGYGTGTYYSCAPGKYSKKKYSCFYTELSEWLYQTPAVVEAFAQKNNMMPISEKECKKLSKQGIPVRGSSVYKFKDFYVCFDYATLSQSDNEQYVSSVEVIETIAATEKQRIMDVAWQWWNDGVQMADIASVTQKNRKVKNHPMNSTQTPEYFEITESFRLDKGFYSFAVVDAKPLYLWHKYEPVFEANIDKKDFHLYGSIEMDDVEASCSWNLNMEKVADEVIVSYGVSTRFLGNAQDGETWDSTMKLEKEMDKMGKNAHKEAQRSNGAAMEQFYKEILN